MNTVFIIRQEKGTRMIKQKKYLILWQRSVLRYSGPADPAPPPPPFLLLAHPSTPVLPQAIALRERLSTRLAPAHSHDPVRSLCCSCFLCCFCFVPQRWLPPSVDIAHLLPALVATGVSLLSRSIWIGILQYQLPLLDMPS